ncbi:MAG TPA: cytochrome c [Acetobacteraceae bacterium]|nr:cytochrome c [Acetobacteraceae bacterium]
MARSRLKILLLTATVLSLCGEAQSAIVLKSTNVTLPDSSVMFPSGPGADVANSNCLSCHSVGMVMNQPVMSRAAWEAEVNKMRNVFKAPVQASDVAAITDYLVSIKGPK